MSTLTQSTPTHVNTTTRARRFTLRHFSLLLVVVALGITGYLSFTKLVAQPMVCVGGGLFNCAVVENSIWARFLGIPVAYLGLGMWTLIGSLLLLEPRVDFLRRYNPIVIFGLALFSFCYHCFLTYTAAFVLRALCPWCLAAHTTMTVLLIVSSIRLYRHLMAAPIAEA